jgi:Thiamin pyrophosphokinase, catalytic domain
VYVCVYVCVCVCVCVCKCVSGVPVRLCDTILRNGGVREAALHVSRVGRCVWCVLLFVCLFFAFSSTYLLSPPLLLCLFPLPPCAASFRICADGGANWLHDENRLFAADRVPDVIRGDLDSARAAVLEHFSTRNSRVLHDADQDTTDIEKCFLSIDQYAHAIDRQVGVLIFLSLPLCCVLRACLFTRATR